MKRKGNILILVMGIVVALASMIGPVIMHSFSGRNYTDHAQHLAVARGAARDTIAYGVRLLNKYASLLTTNSFNTLSSLGGTSLLPTTLISVTRPAGAPGSNTYTINASLTIGPVQFTTSSVDLTSQVAHVLLIAQATSVDPRTTSSSKSTTAYACKIVNVYRKPIWEYSLFADTTGLSTTTQKLDSRFSTSSTLGPVHINGNLSVSNALTFPKNLSVTGTLSGSGAIAQTNGAFQSLNNINTNLTSVRTNYGRAWNSARILDEQDAFCYPISAYPLSFNYLQSNPKEKALPQKYYPSRYAKTVEGFIPGATSSQGFNAHLMVDLSATVGAQNATTTFTKLNTTARAELTNTYYNSCFSKKSGWTTLSFTDMTSAFATAANSAQYGSGTTKTTAITNVGGLGMLEPTTGPENSLSYGTKDNDIWLGRWVARTYYARTLNTNKSWLSTLDTVLTASASTTYASTTQSIGDAIANNTPYVSLSWKSSVGSVKASLKDLKVFDTASGSFLTNTTATGYITPSAQKSTAPIRFWDEQRQKWLFLVQIDVTKLSSGGLYYIAVPTDRSSEQGYGVLLTGNRNILSGYYGGFALATNGSLYIKGNISASFMGLNVPTLLAADNITLLSPNWDNKWSRAGTCASGGPCTYTGLFITGQYTPVSSGVHTTSPSLASMTGNVSNCLRVLQRGDGSSTNNGTATMNYTLQGALWIPFNSNTTVNPNFSINYNSLTLKHDPQCCYISSSLLPNFTTNSTLYMRECAEMPTCDISQTTYTAMQTFLSSTNGTGIWASSGATTYNTGLQNALKASPYPTLGD